MTKLERIKGILQTPHTYLRERVKGIHDQQELNRVYIHSDQGELGKVIHTRNIIQYSNGAIITKKNTIEEFFTRTNKYKTIPPYYFDSEEIKYDHNQEEVKAALIDYWNIDDSRKIEKRNKSKLLATDIPFAVREDWKYSTEDAQRILQNISAERYYRTLSDNIESGRVYIYRKIKRVQRYTKVSINKYSLEDNIIELKEQGEVIGLALLSEVKTTFQEERNILFNYPTIVAKKLDTYKKESISLQAKRIIAGGLFI